MPESTKKKKYLKKCVKPLMRIVLTRMTSKDILICLPVHNRRAITSICVPTVAETRLDATLWVYNVEPKRGEDTADLLTPLCDRLIPCSKASEHEIRRRNFWDFLETGHELLYLTDNDMYHDPAWLAHALAWYQTYRKPVTLFRAKERCPFGTFFTPQGVALRKSFIGNSLLLDRDMAKKCACSTEPHWEKAVVSSLRTSYVTPECALVEHFSQGGLHFKTFADGRSVRATPWLEERYCATLREIEERGRVERYGN